VIFWLALRRLLPLLAVVSLALAPVAAPAATAGMHASVAMSGLTTAMPDMVMDDMPCCPHETPVMPDCSKSCPLMALCLAKVASGLPSGIGLPVRVAVVEGPTWGGDISFASLAQAPPAEPPRS
jgi:hypothetical protein